MPIEIRPVTTNDSAELLGIYAPYVTETAITFEYDVPTADEFTERIRSTLEKYPYIAAVENGEIIGYAYAGVFKSRAAYDYDVEVTIYIKKEHRRSGVGKLLYSELEQLLKKQGITNLYACIACTENEDEFLTNDSVEFHQRMGYRLVGTFKQCGYKYNRWYDMVWMEKIIGEHLAKQPEIIKFADL
ncbi:MAG: N-acetyltransferase [Oscillospiraceae bacterium]|nr:N-acetyltransferase [Oscillospiraceae bacterium]